MYTQPNKAEIESTTTTTTVVEKLQRLLVRIDQSNQRALQLMKSPNHLTSGRALVAIGLCQQAKEQIRAACQNMGFSLNSLLVIDEKATCAGAEEQRRQLKSAKAAIVKLLVQKINVSREAVFISMQAFAEDSATVASMMVSRAEHHLKASAN